LTVNFINAIWFNYIDVGDELEVYMTLLHLFPTKSGTVLGEALVFVSSSLLLHIANGLRWQLWPTYVGFLLLIISQTPYLDIFRIICFVLTVVTCSIFPMLHTIFVPERSVARNSIGVQDICIQYRNRYIWSRLYYSTKSRIPFSLQIHQIIKPIFTHFISVLVAYLVLLHFLPNHFSSSYMTYPLLIHLAITSFHIIMREYNRNTSVEYFEKHSVKSTIKGIANYGGISSLLLTHLQYWRIRASADQPYCYTAPPLQSPSPSSTPSGTSPSSVNNPTHEAEMVGDGNRLSEKRPLQLAIVCHGLGGNRSILSTVCMEMAQKGYFVISPEFTDETASSTRWPDGTIINYRKYDLKPGETSDSRGAFEFRNRQLIHRSEEVVQILTYIGSLLKYHNDTDCAKTCDTMLAAVSYRQGGDASQSRGLQSEDGTNNPWRVDDGEPFQGSVLLASLASGGFEIGTCPPILVGHSFGGATVLHLSLSSKDRAAVAYRHRWGGGAMVLFDPWMFPLDTDCYHDGNAEASESTGNGNDESRGGKARQLRAKEGTIPCPLQLLCFHAEYFQWPENRVLEDRVVQQAQKALQVKLLDTGHLNYTEVGFLSPVLQQGFGKYFHRSIGSRHPLRLLDNIMEVMECFLFDLKDSVVSTRTGVGNGDRNAGDNQREGGGNRSTAALVCRRLTEFEVLKAHGF